MIIDNDYLVTEVKRVETHNVKTDRPKEEFKYQLADDDGHKFTVASPHPLEGFNKGERVRVTIDNQTIQTRFE